MEPFLLTDFAGTVYNKKEIKKIADFGTGSGVTAILLSEYFKKAAIWGIEIQRRLAKTAKKNVTQNKLDHRIEILEADIKDLPPSLRKGSFDLVVSNPPFRKAGTGKINPDSEKAIARHEMKITLKEFLNSCDALLRVMGSLIMTYHPNRLDELLQKMTEVKIKPRYLKFVHHRPDSEANIVLVEGIKRGRHSLKCLPPVFLNKANL